MTIGNLNGGTRMILAILVVFAAGFAAGFAVAATMAMRDFKTLKDRISNRTRRKE